MRTTTPALSAAILLTYLPATFAASSPFQLVHTPNENFNNDLLAVSASSPTDIWAVGQATIHYDGTQWTAFPAPLIKGDNTGSLSGVADISPVEAWAVGTINIGEANPGQVIEQWNGTAWSVFPGPQFAAGDQPALKGLAAITSSDMWAVGSLVSNGGETLNLLFEHWNGLAWTASTIITGDAFLLGVAADATGNSTNDVWAVGFEGAENDNSRTLVMHWNGTRWKQSPSPSVGNGANQLNGVAALSPDNVWAVGFSTPVAPPQEAATLTLIEHWDGTSWTIVPSPNRGPNSIYQSNMLQGITAISPTDIWAFGESALASGSGMRPTLLEHWDGNAWTIMPSPNPTNGDFLGDVLSAGVAFSSDNVWIVGSQDRAPHEATLVIHSTAAAAQ